MLRKGASPLTCAGGQDALVPAYPVLEDDEYNNYRRVEMEYFI